MEFLLVSKLFHYGPRTLWSPWILYRLSEGSRCVESRDWLRQFQFPAHSRVASGASSCVVCPQREPLHTFQRGHTTVSCVGITLIECVVPFKSRQCCTDVQLSTTPPYFMTFSGKQNEKLLYGGASLTFCSLGNRPPLPQL